MEKIFGGNPLATPVGQRIDKATDVTLTSENWGLNMEITDIINETEEGPKDAMRALRRKIVTNTGKNYQVINLCLTVVETCVKNCGRRFHLQVANKDFLQELIKLILPKNEAPPSIQERILGFIQTWADAFKGSPELKEVEKCYQELKNKGIEFPMTDLDKMAPIHTPARTHAVPEPSADRPPSAASDVRFSRPSTRQGAPAHMAMPHMPPHHAVAPHLAAAAGPPQPVAPATPTNEQLAKLRSELDIVHGNCQVLNEMVSEVNPNEGSHSDLQLMGELNATCHRMQERVVALIGHVGDHEGVTEDLLRANDELNNVFLRYSRFEKNMTTPPAGVATHPPALAPMPAHPQPGPAASPAAPGAGGADLMCLDGGQGVASDGGVSGAGGPPTASALSQHMSGLGLGESSVSGTLSQLSAPQQASLSPAQEFDMFAESRQATPSGGSVGVSQQYANQEQAGDLMGGLGQAVHGRNAPYSEVSAKDNDAKEMAAWLEPNEQKSGQSTDSSAAPTATSSEFDRFLAERALAGDTLPDRDTQGGEAPPIPTRGRQMQRDDTDTSLFAL